MKRIAAALMILASGAGLSAGSAASLASTVAQEAESPVKSVKLVFLEGGNRGPIRLGFDIQLEAEWHLYWANPGDGGLAPSARWDLPKGFTAGPLIHPVPEKSVKDGFTSLTHGGRVLLLCDIAPPPGGIPAGPWKASAVFEWMACQEICVVGETPVQARFPPEPAHAAEGKALLERFSPRFPKPLSGSGVELAAARPAWTGSAWRIEASLAGARAAEASDVFIYPVDGYVIDHAGLACRAGKITVPLKPSKGPGSPPPAEIKGVVVIDGSGYDFTLPLARRDPSSGREGQQVASVLRHESIPNKPRR